MITSYVTPDRSILYLSLAGALDEDSSDDLINEYYERHTNEVKQCILDLGGVEQADPRGLNVLHRLSLLAQVDNIELTAVARGSGAETEIAESARGFWVTVVDEPDLPFARRAG